MSQFVFAQAQTRAEVEVIIVDDGSTDATVPSVRAQFPSVRIVEKAHTGADNSRNQGSCARRDGRFHRLGLHGGAALAGEPGAALVDEGRPIVGGRIVHPGGLWQRMVGVSDFGEFQGLARKEVSNIPTCNMGVRRRWLSGTGFDPDLRVGGDGRSCSALRKRGVRLDYDPEVQVFHHPRVDARHFFARALSYGAGRRARDVAIPACPIRAWSRPVSPAWRSSRWVRRCLDWYRLATAGRLALASHSCRSAQVSSR